MQAGARYVVPPYNRCQVELAVWRDRTQDTYFINHEVGHCLLRTLHHTEGVMDGTSAWPTWAELDRAKKLREGSSL